MGGFPDGYKGREMTANGYRVSWDQKHLNMDCGCKTENTQKNLHCIVYYKWVNCMINEWSQKSCYWKKMGRGSVEPSYRKPRTELGIVSFPSLF